VAQFLQPEIKAGLVAVRDEVDRSVITIRGDGLFAPASATLASDREALMKRIAEALAGIAGPVLVTGHTDNTAMRSLRFPSNWHLSDERARVVRDLMIRRRLTADRVRAEGRADGEPAVPNDTAANRAVNRRVEITLVTGKPGAPATQTAPATPATPAAPAASR
jgi:type VI secretion system protein ImpK